MFDIFVGIDWSGSKSPKRSFSIAYAYCSHDSRHPPNYDVSKLSRTDVFNKLANLVESNNKSLVGIDCNFGYNIDIGQEQFGHDISALKFWKYVDEINGEHDNFFAGEFWLHPKFKHYFWTQGKQPEWYKAERLRRTTELNAINQGAGTPETPFKLIGAKQVGKGGLAGMRMAHQLKGAFKDKVALWPFERHLCNTANLVITEIYPRLFIRHADHGNQKVRDINTLNNVINQFDFNSYTKIDDNLNDHLTDAIISSAGLKWFHQHEFDIQTVPLPSRASLFEGWIFGVKP